ncbi:unnamed protein product [Phytomonas sp. EM1]|nr:unnamed protein product [Phytomonas sp. EM1]|eukprot:CCW62149.1 unnamed protein product [Phytomonas sp. isolate EM1]
MSCSTQDSGQNIDKSQLFSRQLKDGVDGVSKDHSSAQLTDVLSNEPDTVSEQFSEIHCVPRRIDIPQKQLRQIIDIALHVYNNLVLVPSRSTWRKVEGARRELEREIERTAMQEIAETIKKEVDRQLGGCWHVIYGYEFGSYVTHKSLSFCYFQLNDANVMVWRQGG